MSVRETFFSINVADMQRAVKFYAGALGGGTSYATERWTSMHIAGVRLGLFHLPAHEGGRTGLHFVVDDLDATRASIEKAGGRCAPPVEVAPGVVVMDATDTEGNTFAIRQD